jgi:uncharacterized protein
MIHDEVSLVDYIQSSELMMDVLLAAQSANLPQWFVGAGFIRNTVWDILSGIEPSFEFNDIDLAYYDDDNKSEDTDRKIANELHSKLATNWEVVNQAYAHAYNSVDPYTSAMDGLAHWTETATCVGATLDIAGKVVILAPWGLDDLLSMTARITPIYSGKQYFENLYKERIATKNWQTRWPNLKVIYN